MPKILSGEDQNVKLEIVENKQKELVESKEKIAEDKEAIKQAEKETVLQDRLKKTREAYAKDDYDKGEKFRKLKKLLGASLKTTPDQLAEVQKKRAEYEETAKSLTTAKLEGIQRRHMGADVDKEEMGKEIKDLLVEMDLKEKMNLINARTEAINEKWKVKEGDDQKERWKKNIRNAGKGSLQWYRNLSFLKVDTQNKVGNDELVVGIIPNEKDLEIADNFLLEHQAGLRDFKTFDKENPFFPGKRDEVLSAFFKDLYSGSIGKSNSDNMQRFLVNNQDKRFGSIYRGFLNEFGKEIIPEKDETMAEWSRKLAILVLDKKIKVQV